MLMKKGLTTTQPLMRETFNITQSPPPSPAPVASDPEFQVSISAIGDSPLFASGSAHITQPFANPHSEPSTSSPLECLTPQIELTLDSDSRAQHVQRLEHLTCMLAYAVLV
jgi:hypothetical protein